MNRIGTLNEHTLHDQLKRHYMSTPDYNEIKVGNHYIDVIRNHELVEIQTRGFSRIKKKLTHLLNDYRVRLVYPLPVVKTIRVYNKNKRKILYERKSPKQGKLIDIVHELIYIPHLISHPNFTFEVVFTHELETRCQDGRGSWRRGGISLVNRELIRIVDTITFHSALDYQQLIPDNLPAQFTNRYLIENTNLTHAQTYKLTNFLKKIGVIEIIEFKRRAQIFKVVN